MPRLLKRAVPLAEEATPRAHVEDAAVQPDRRSDFRVSTIFQAGSLTTSRGEWPCLVGNVGGGGSMVTCAAELEVGDDIVLKLSNGRRLGGTVAWQREGRLGLSFHENLPLTGLLASELPAGHRQRSPRFRSHCAAEVTAGGRVETTQIIDISEGGLKIKATEAVVGASVTVALPGLSAVPGRIRWARDGKAGIVFEERLPFETLSRWYTEHRIELGRAAGGLLGAFAAMLASPAAAAEAAQQSSAQTYGSAEILDHVGVVIEAQTTSSAAPSKTAASTETSSSGAVVVSTSATAPPGSEDPASSGSLIYQYN